MSEWKEYKLGELSDITSAKRIFYSEYVKTGIPFYRSKEIIDKFNKREVVTELFISEERFNEINNKFGAPQKDDILLTSVGTLGIPYLVNEKDQFYFKDGNLTWFRKIDNKKFSSKYFYLWLKSKIGKQKLDEITIGSTQPALTIEGLKKISILLPSFEVQTQIASVLSSLDDKIDLLHRQNKTLEQLAETLFRQWFIEEAEEQSKKQLQLGNLIDSVSITHKFPSDNVIFLNTSDILLGDVLVHESVNINTLPGQAKKTIQKNDILFSEIRPANGRYAYIDFDADNYVVSTKLMVLRSKNIISQAFIYFFLINSQTVDWLQMLAESRSGTFPQITFDQLRNLKINIPSDSILKETVEWCESALQKIKSNTNQIRTLTQLRDTLLPKLMSGEASIR